MLVALICATRNSTPIVMSFASLYPMHRHGKEGVERRKNSTTHFSIKGLDPFGVCTKKEKKKKNNSNDKQYHLKKNVVTNQSEAATVIPIRWQQQKNVFFFSNAKQYCDGNVHFNMHT